MCSILLLLFSEYTRYGKAELPCQSAGQRLFLTAGASLQCLENISPEQPSKLPDQALQRLLHPSLGPLQKGALEGKLVKTADGLFILWRSGDALRGALHRAVYDYLHRLLYISVQLFPMGGVIDVVDNFSVLIEKRRGGNKVLLPGFRGRVI